MLQFSLSISNGAGKINGKKTEKPHDKWYDYLILFVAWVLLCRTFAFFEIKVNGDHLAVHGMSNKRY